ncbi:uncharacterized protein LOC132867684 [Neoarius graeffei]|uniref:uncharacterized protein LOC132867684 n=1 Tax=Neoarius graeffei TaxID=443677 RepID=UPI00298C4EB7|nr:uncharacterized protein LOC132867684 [Neoarius graeffei]XP_060756674.1 uncharacterized protein LOC132867684 [Neoarius graeffei]XP_060756675.1 uncharacterized protein LOC132867684 [Neoarius graeffei]XP_060756676.1 uncharacterized protein LOC132867684 [Neoarius graeffei]
MDSKKPVRRHHLLCPVCFRTQETLSCHLRRSCMKNSPEAAIETVVEKAKNDVFHLLKYGRTFDYVVLTQILADGNPIQRWIEELERHHLVVTRIPPSLPNAEPATGHRQSETVTGPQGEPSGEFDRDLASTSSGEVFPCDRDVNYSNKAKHNMLEMGLYQKHSLDHPLLKDFAKHLELDLNYVHYKQEAENVSRYLYYVNPKTPSLQFVNDREKLRQYLRHLSDAKLKKQTQQNYLKSLKRFLHYHTTLTNLSDDDVALHTECMHFMDFIDSLKKATSKLVSKEITQKRHDMLIEKDQLTPHECWAVLEAAKQDFLAIMDKLSDSCSSPLEHAESIFVVYYLEAVVILKHLQRPCIVENMTVTEWVNRKLEGQHFIIGVKHHKNSSTHVVVFALSEEEERWFDTYYRWVRPHLLRSIRKRKRDVEDEDAKDRFFVSSTGKKIHNPSNDLLRLHSKYNLWSVNSHTVRRVFETAGTTLTEGEKSLLSQYLAHSDTTAEKHYHMKQVELIVKASELLSNMGKVSSAGPSGEGTSHKSSEESSSCGDHYAVPSSSIKQPVISLTRLPPDNEKVKFFQAFEILLQTHPVTLSGKRPEVKERRTVSQDFQRKLYNYWGKKQFEMRVEHTRSQFSRRKPTKERVDAWVKKQGWKMMTAEISDEVLKNWKPSGSEDCIMDNTQIQKLVQTQQWRGLHITEFEGKGRGIITTRIFEAGEVLCDCHGTVVTFSEGQKIHRNNTERETGYVFFFKNKKGESMCIDAHSDTCDCHPGMQTIGRLINHSKKKANIKPKYFSVKINGEERDVILFLATRTLLVNEEVLFDYGINRKSFGGEGRDLDWLS